MTLDEILTEYEELWMKAALEGREQFHDPCNAPRGSTCAWLVAPKELQSRVHEFLIPLRAKCPICSRQFGYALANALIHLNNYHKWTWDQLANKTRDILVQGGVKV